MITWKTKTWRKLFHNCSTCHICRNWDLGFNVLIWINTIVVSVALFSEQNECCVCRTTWFFSVQKKNWKLAPTLLVHLTAVRYSESYSCEKSSQLSFLSLECRNIPKYIAILYYEEDQKYLVVLFNLFNLGGKWKKHLNNQPTKPMKTSITWSSKPSAELKMKSNLGMKPTAQQKCIHTNAHSVGEKQEELECSRKSTAQSPPWKHSGMTCIVGWLECCPGGLQILDGTGWLQILLKGRARRENCWSVSVH